MHKYPEVIDWHNRLNRHESEETSGDNEGQGSLQRDRNTKPPYLFPEKPVCKTRSNS